MQIGEQIRNNNVTGILIAENELWYAVDSDAVQKIPIQRVDAHLVVQ